MYDHKTAQTRQQILDSFIHLVNEKDISKITINDITTGAQINRGTFYRHFTDKFDLIEKTEQIIFTEIEDTLTAAIINPQVTSPFSNEFDNYREQVLLIIKQHAAFISAMLSPNGDLTFEAKLRQQLIKLVNLGLGNFTVQQPINDSDRQLIIQFTANGLIGIIRYWLLHDNIPNEKISEIATKIMSNGTLAALGFEESR